MTSYAFDVTDALSAPRSCQTLQPTLASSVVFYMLIFITVCLLAVLLLVSNKPNASRTLSAVSSAGVDTDQTPEPPSPWGNLPLLGYLPWLGAKPYVTMLKLSRRYGNVYQIRFGCRSVVVLNGLETIRQAFVRQGDAFAARPDFPSFAKFCEGRSIAFNSLDPVWIAQRKMAMRAMGMFTSSSRQKSHVEALIHRHAVALADRLVCDSTAADKPPVAVDPFGPIESSLVAILFETCFGSSGDGDVQLYSHMMQRLHDMRDVMPVIQTADIMPWTAPFFRRSLQRYTDSLTRFDQLVTNKVEALVNAGLPADQPTCIVHALYNLCLPGTCGDSDADALQRSRITATVQDFIGAGSEAVVQFIHWAILYAAKYPQVVQDRVRDEIQRTIGRSSVVVGFDRNRMPYTEACMWEIVRHSCLTPMSLPHAALRDTTLAGSAITAGTVVFANFYSTGWDADVWGDPEVFRPERFLEPTGQVDRAAVDRFLCFGVGRRRCLGAQLGRLEMFVFFVVLMQKCTFSTPPGTQLATDGDFVLTNRAKKFSVLVQPSAN